MAGVAAYDERKSMAVHHPRYPLLPAAGMSTAPWLMAAGTRPRVREVLSSHKPVELIDAHYFYPDGVAAAMLARWMGLPYIITARGSDINLIATYSWPRRLMLRAAANASAVIAVSRALAAAMVAMGMPESRIHVLRNGVDLEFFSPLPGSQERRRPSGSPATFLSVGALKPAKGHDIAIRFIHRLQEARLVIAGAGPDERRLRLLCERLDVSPRVQFAGVLDAGSLRDCYRKADALVLMSEREGMPNVVLESLACGTPVLAADVGGIAEIVSSETAGELVDRRNAEALVAAWRRLQARGIDRRAVRRHAEQFSWDETITGLHRLMHRCARGNAPAGACQSRGAG
jgi:teichuronic acid biosynthesis glycosyltransferase TuaC